MHTRILTAAALAIAVAAVPAASSAAPPGAPRLDTDLLESKLESFASAADHAVVAEVRNGDAEWSAAIGPRSLEADEGDARPGDRFRVGSITKSMTATVLLQLQAEGELDLDDPIGEHLPGVLPYEGEWEPTVRELMSHRGGVPDHLPRLYESLLEDDDLTDFYANHRTHYRPAELIAIGTEGGQLFEPDDGFAYSNTGYTVLGLLIEELTGDDLDDVLEDRVLDPADLDDTYFGRPGTSGVRGPHLDPYLTTGDPAQPYLDTSKLSYSQLWAGGNVVSTAGDLNDFYRAMTDGTLLDAASLAEATAFKPTGKSFGYGLGLFGIRPGCAAEPEAVFLGHNGDTLGHEANSFHSLDSERQISVAWNIVDRHDVADPDALEQAWNELLYAGLCGTDKDDDPTPHQRHRAAPARLEPITA
ncbi:serine hydrolase domain-containing protein [Glycomyces algeriensis]|uniref:Hydrolase n=1 Tax=Glycomyces algeriensis TaxID=256037 RepID=A0A9W6GCU4_9ACTN|nr:serine hydrolase domain-containing protein [Glycomyces algeriensis]MDA1368360.1 serine hydrolase [Glycomyces algeriensis]MDR7351803.1 D-alanyl-D-alanine carboxypeptidase [Glycomyces algeriensis]GLI44530.1 hydrolase [Glycomyces algeriensis]